MLLEKQLDQMAEVVTQVKDLAEKQKTDFEITRTEQEEKLEKLALDLHEQAQKNSQFEAVLSKLSNMDVENKSDEKAVENAKAVTAAFMRGGKAAVDELLQKSSYTNTLVGYEGGYLTVPAAMAGILEARIFETSPVRQVASIETGSSGSIEFVLDDDEIDVQVQVEGNYSRNASRPEVGKVTIKAHSYTAYPSATQEMLEDGARDIAGWLINKASNDIARKENTDFVGGDGVNGARGFLTYTAGSSSYARGSVEQVNSGGSSALTADGLIALQDSLKEVYQRNAVFVMKRSTFSAARKLQDGNNQYLWGLGIAGLNGNPVYGQLELLGRPVVLMDDMPAVASNALAIAYGDFNLGYTIYDRLGIQVLQNPFSVTGVTVFETRKRTGGGVTNFEAIKIQKIAS